MKRARRMAWTRCIFAMKRRGGQHIYAAPTRNGPFMPTLVTPDHFWRRNWLKSTHVHALDRMCTCTSAEWSMSSAHPTLRSVLESSTHIPGLLLDFALLFVCCAVAVVNVQTLLLTLTLLLLSQCTIAGPSKSFETGPNPNRRRSGVRCHKKCISSTKLCMRFARFASYLHSKAQNSVVCTDVSDFLLPSSYGNEEEGISPANVRHFLVQLFGHSETYKQRLFIQSSVRI